MAVRLSTGMRNKILGDGSGASMQDLLAGGVLRFYSGAQPSSADLTESGTLLLEVSAASATFVPDTGSGSTNGLNFSNASSGSMSKDATVWSGVGVADGTAGYARFYDATRTTGASTTAVRMDLSISSSGAQIIMSSAVIVTSATTTIDTFVIDLPAS